MTLVIFSYFAAVILVSGVMVVALSNPVQAVLSLLVMFFHVAGIYVLLNAEFIAAVQIIVYAGAILVLYLFVIMLLNLSGKEKSHNRNPWIGGFVGLTIVAELFFILNRSKFTPKDGVDTIDAIQKAGNTQAIGQALFTTWLLPFEVASLILLVAMIGAIVLAKNGILKEVWSEKQKG